MSILVLSSVLSLLYEWRLGLVTMVFLPPLILGMVMQIWYMVVDGAVQKTALEKSAKVAVEAINNIRTVAGLRYINQCFFWKPFIILFLLSPGLRKVELQGV